MRDGHIYGTDILLFGSMGHIGPEVQKLLVSRGFRTEAVPFPQNIFRDEPGYRRALVQAISGCRPGIVFPIGNPLAMSRFKELVGQGVPLGTILNCRKTDIRWEEAVRNARIAVEKEETIRRLDSKVLCYDMARELGLMQPAVYGTPEAIPEGVKVVFKRDVSFGGHGVHLPNDIGALKRLIAHQSPGEPFLIEEFIEGQDYSLDAVRNGQGSIVSGGYACIPATAPASSSGQVYRPLTLTETVSGSHTTDDGQAVSSCRTPKVKNIYNGFGPAVVREVLNEGDSVLEKMRACAATILEHLDYQGVCGFDFRLDHSGHLWLLECNPRFTGGISAQAAAGFDIPWALYLQGLGSGRS